MEGGRNQEDNAPDEVIILDDSCEGDVLSHETPTDTTNAEIGAHASAQVEAASVITEKSLVTQVMTISSHKNIVSLKGSAIHVLADIPAPPIGDCLSKDTAAFECLSVEGEQDVNSAGCQQRHSTDLTALTCQPSHGEPIKAPCISDDASSQFVKTDSNIGENDTRIDAGKNDEHTPAVDESSESKLVNISSDSKSITYSSDDTLIKCGLVNESTSGDVLNDQQVIPVSSEVVIPVSSDVVIPVSSEVIIPVSSEEPSETRSHKIPSDVIDEQLKVACTDTASYKCAKELFQGTQAPRYIIIRSNKNTKIKQEVIRKPGEKLTSLLQRLTAGKVGDVAVTLSKNKPLSVSATEAQTETHQSSLSSGSPSLSVASTRCEPACPQRTVKETSPSTSGKTTITFSPVLHSPFPVVKLPSSQTDSSMKTDQSQAPLQSQNSETLHFEKIGIPVKMPPGVDPAHLLPQLWYVAQAGKSHSISTSSLPSKTAKVSSKSGEQEFTIFAPADDSKQPSNSSVTPGLPVPSFPADKIKYVVNCPPVQGSRTPNIVFASPDGHSIVLRKADETCLQPFGVQNTTRKSKYQFSLLQNTAAKFPEAVQMNAGIQNRTMMSSQTVRSLLSTSSKTAPTLKKSTKHSVSETGSVNASTSLSGLKSTITAKPSTHPNTQCDQQAHIRLTSSGQIIFRPVSQPIVGVTRSSNKLSPGGTSATLSKLAAAVSINSVPINKTGIAPISSTATSGTPVIVMPTPVTGTPVPTILAPSSVVSSRSTDPAGTVTYNNITATSNKDTLKPVFVPKTLETKTAIESSPHTVQNFSDLINCIALQSASGTSVNKPSPNVSSSMQALNIALLQQLRQGGPLAAPVKVMVSQSSGVQSAAKCVVAQSEPSAYIHCGTITTPTGKKITLSRAAQKSATVTAGGKQIPKLIYPKPASTEVLFVAPAKSKSVSLLPMSLFAKNQTTPESSGAAALASSIPQDQPKDAKPKVDHIVEVSSLKKESTNNTAPNSYSKKVKVSTNAATPRKSKNAVYTAILRTGQGPVSVRVVAPDMNDDSSDTMSDSGLSNIKLSEESALTTEDTRCNATGIDNGISPSNKLLGNHVCCEEPSVYDQESRDSCVRDDAVLKTGLQEMGSSLESVVSEHHVQDVDGEETDTDTEIMAMEEQDMSVLRQLLTNNTDTKSPFDTETIQNIDHLAAPFDLVDSSNAENQSDSTKADHEDMALIASDADNCLINPIVTEQYSDAISCHLKIESVFSLRDSGNFEDTELPVDHVSQELPDDQTKLLPVFNVRTSDDWKSFLSPCFVVLERLPKSETSSVGGSPKNASKCSGYCRKRTLDYLCNLNLLRCINHPDPFMFLKLKPKRRFVKNVIKKVTKREMITDMSNSYQVNVQEPPSGSFVDVKGPDLSKTLSKLSSVAKETCVKKNGKKSSSAVKGIHGKKAVDKTLEMVNIRPLKKPLSIFPLLAKNQKGPVSELHMKPACFKKTMSKSFPVATEACGKEDMKLCQQAEPGVLGGVSKPSPVMKETDVNEDVVKSVLHSSSLITGEELPQMPPEKPNISDSVYLSTASTGDTSTAGGDQKPNKTFDRDSSSDSDSSKLNKALRQLQKQVNKKRATMLIEKLCRKKGTEPQKKHAVTKYKNKVEQKRRKNVALKKSRRKQLTKYLPVSADAIVSGKRGELPEHNFLPGSDQISHDSLQQNSVPQNKEAVCTDTSGVKPVSGSRITHFSNVQNQNIKTKGQFVHLQPKVPNISQEKIQAVKTKGQFVHLQPKVPNISQEKIQAALHSLKNYLAATGRKPTTGNTQYILLKIDEQHVLVKWPMTAYPQSDTSVPTSQQSTVSISAFQQSSSTVPTTQQGSSTVPTTQQSSSMVPSITITPVTSVEQSEARSTSAVAISNNAGDLIHRLVSTSGLSTTTANVNSIFTMTNLMSNITTFKTKRARPILSTSVSTSSVSNSALGKEQTFKIIRRQSAKKSSSKLLPCNAPSAGKQKNITNVIMENQARLNKQTMISLLKSDVLTQSHNKAQTSVSCVSSVSPIITSAISSPVVSDSSSKASSADAHSSKKTGSDNTNITLSHLPPNSLLLPGRRRPHIVLSEEERQAKRRKLEKKYPLPPGVVIKSEPDDYQDDFIPLLPTISSTFSEYTATMPMEHTECPEPLTTSSDNQLLSVEDSFNIDPYLTDTGHAAEHAGGLGAQGLPMNSAVDGSQSSHSDMEAENSSDEQDEPPALLDETMDDSDENIEINSADAQEDVPPVLQPMFTSSCSSLVKGNVQEFESTEFTPKMPAHLTTFGPYSRHVVTARDSSPSTDSTSTTSLYSESSIDSGVDTNFPSTSFSHTSLHAPIANRPVSKNLKIQYLKDLLKKKEMEIENMKRQQSELLISDFDI